MKMISFISFRNWEAVIITILAAISAFVIALVFGKFFIPFMRKKKLGQQILTEITWHQHKAGTPTMGGLIFIFASLISSVVFSLLFEVNILLPLLLWGFAAVFGVVGFLDDFVKVVKHRNLGLTVIQKLILQLAVSLAFVSLLRSMGYLTANLYIPLINITLPLNWVLYLTLAALYISGMVNAVNFGDGVDGLLGSSALPILVFFAVVALMKQSYGVSIFAASLVGGVLAFLLYNFNPAKVFMGDTGSQFLGGAFCALAFALNMPLILVVIGFIYIVEIVSVVMQVTYFKLTKGKRIFRMSPIHHHFEMGGWSEKKLCAVFGGITLMLCVAAWFMLGGQHIY